jgi:uncharacterized protein (DUF697 family)
MGYPKPWPEANDWPGRGYKRMRLLRRKSKWDLVQDTTATIMAQAMASAGLRRVTKVAAGVIGGAVAATAASAAVSSLRHKDEDS